MNPGSTDPGAARERCAVVSIGTNSTRLLIADIGGRGDAIVVVQRAIGTRIGEGLGERGSLGDEPMQRTLAAIRRFRRIAGRHLQLFAIATSALRRADNGTAFLTRVRSVLDVPVKVLSGEAEAKASYRGAVAALGSGGGRIGVFDIGGGSTEYAAGNGSAPETAVSCEIGAVRLTEAVPELDGRAAAVREDALRRARRLAGVALRPVAGVAPVQRVALVGGTATTAAAIVSHRPRTSAQPLTRSDLQRLVDRLASLDLAARKRVRGMRPQRADIMLAGAVLLDTALETVGADAAVATSSDLLLGFLLSQREATG